MKPRTLLLVAAALALAGSALLLYSHSRHAPERPEIRATREALVADFQRATALEILAAGDEHGFFTHPQVVAVIRRSDDPSRWARWMDDIRRAQEPGPLIARHLPGLRLHLTDGKTLVTELASLPYDSILAVHHDNVVAWEVQFESSLHDLLKPYVDREYAARHRGLARELARHPNTPIPSRSQMGAPGRVGRMVPAQGWSPGLGTAPQPRAASFGDAKARLVKLFQDCDFVNLAPNGGGALVKYGVAHAAWQQMTRAVENAKEGWVIPGAPEMTIGINVYPPPGQMGRSIRLGYSHGQLACDDDTFGASPRSVQPGPEFADGLRKLQAAVKVYQRQWDEQQRLRREYNKRTGKELP